MPPETSVCDSLITDLSKIVGHQYVIWKPEDLLVYEYDGSIDKAMPQAVVLPSTSDEVSEIVRTANRHGAYIVARGAGTSLSGGAVALRNSVIIALTRLTKLIEVDPENRVAIVEPGMINLHLSEKVSHLGLFYAPDPASQKTCTIGGNIGENAGGPHCLALGVTTNHVLGLEVVLADGSLTWFGGTERESTGYDLRGVFVGSEGTLGIVTKIAVRLLPKPELIHSMLAAFTTMDAASNTVSEIIAEGMVPSALEMMDRNTIDAVEPFYHPGYPVEAQAVLIIEVDGLKNRLKNKPKPLSKSAIKTVRWKFAKPMTKKAEPSSGKLERVQLVLTDPSPQPIISWMVLYLAQSCVRSYGRLIKLQPNSKLPSQMYFTRVTETFTPQYYSTNEIQKKSNKPYSQDPEFWKLVSPQVVPCRENTG